MSQVLKLKILSMNKFLFCKKYFFVFLIINSLNISVFGKERNCLNYPYPDGIYYKNKSNNQKQFIFTQSAFIKSKNNRKIVFNKRKYDLYAMASLHKHIKLNSPNYNEQKIGVYRIYSCFNTNGTYKISYAQRVENLNSLNSLQKVKRFFVNIFQND